MQHFSTLVGLRSRKGVWSPGKEIMDQTIVEQHLDEITLFVLDCQLFHGNRKVRSHDLAEALQVDVPTDEVFTLGVKRVFDKDYVNRLNRVKSAMVRECVNVGPPLAGLSGYAVPDSKTDDLAERLEKLKVKGNAIKDDILARFTQICEDYAASHPKWKDVITKGAFSETYVRDRIHFGYRCIKIKAARDSGLIAAGIQEEVGGLLGSLLTSIAKAAKRFIEESLTGRAAVTRKALRPLLAARDKLSGFCFLDSRVQPLCEIIDRVVKSMPDDGPIDGIHLANLVGMASILLNSKLALEVGSKAGAQDPDKVFEEFFQIAAAQQSAGPAAPVGGTQGTSPQMPAPSAPIAVPSASTARVMVPSVMPQPVVDLGNLFA